MPTRGCGTRQEGGLYIESESSPLGRDIEDFLFDPATRYAGEFFRGGQLVATQPPPNGPAPSQPPPTNVLMWVGKENYPYVPDFVEEARRFGISKRIPRDFPIERLQPGSKLILIHARGRLTAAVHAKIYAKLYDALGQLGWSCPKSLHTHAGHRLDPSDQAQELVQCLGTLWPLVSLRHGTENEVKTTRQIGDTAYAVPYVGDIMTEEELAYEPAIFMWAPITNLAYITGGSDTVPEDIEQRRRGLRLPLQYEEE